jgi:peptidoglycan/LPS O-acetylase OafA/YrhL
LWLGAHLPLQRVGARNDYSYGVYIYAYPVQQLLATWHAQRFGYWAYLGLSVLGVAPFAAASWWVVEKRALRLKRLDLGARRRSTPAASGAPS